MTISLLPKPVKQVKAKKVTLSPDAPVTVVTTTSTVTPEVVVVPDSPQKPKSKKKTMVKDQAAVIENKIKPNFMRYASVRYKETDNSTMSFREFIKGNEELKVGFQAFKKQHTVVV